MKNPITTIPTSFFSENRSDLLEYLPDNSICILYSGTYSVLSLDQKNAFRTDSNFFYLTGIDEPDCYLTLIKSNGKTLEVLYIPAIDPEFEKWEGNALKTEQAAEISGISKILTNHNFKTDLFRYTVNADLVFSTINTSFSDQPLTHWHQFLSELKKRLPCHSFKNAAPLLHSLRACKDSVEIDSLKKTFPLINQALKKAVPKIKNGAYEYEIEAAILYQYHSSGYQPSFDTIVASGKNATILHYTEHRSQLQNSDLLLIDTGVMIDHYCGDITRVFPVSGKFSNRQKKIYETNLTIQEKVIASIRTGMTMRDIFTVAGEIQNEILRQEKLLSEDTNHSSITFHSIGHSLGLDVHDPINPAIPLVEGTVLTIEPGIYLKDENIGIRIEDVILLKDSGNEVLSSEIPKSISEIENMLAQS